jgi:hypothetical protein
MSRRRRRLLLRLMLLWRFLLRRVRRRLWRVLCRAKLELFQRPNRVLQVVLQPPPLGLRGVQRRGQPLPPLAFFRLLFATRLAVL